MTLDLTAPVEELAKALIDIPSVSGEEQEIAAQVESALREHAHLEVTRLGNSIVARTTLGRAERVVVAGHLDTVPIKGNVPGRWDDDGATLWGRGAVDMKAGVAVQLSLAAALTEPTRDVTWVFYDQEEVEETRNGLGRISRERPDLLEADFAVLGEPTGGVIEGGCNGTIRVDVVLPGKAAHSARSWKGVNAIHAAAPVLAALADYEAATVEVDGLSYREGLNAVGVRGGIAGNVVPDECAVTVNYRFAPDKTADEAIAHVSDVVARGGVGEHRIVVTDRAEGCRPGLDASLAQSFTAAVAATGVEPPRAKLGWTDVARFGALGIPAVNYGPGDPELAHADEERCPVSQIRDTRAGLEAWLTS
ncbi:succinyl-diaminopimelate desuccinylase [Demequina zhanjiangensis]|uniref:Succinyl-diaminopimelate desuccinylase n=1 Tax=Demequina zhanjiangensis TaxID=3051659 RepID=A0ABT8G133_9MICO|nr:succinyl-diaminopimelate desuccinylase [Demequina sp. SYSU T00b26]MDN4472803.1 succinyl-diaminopimelate desuccinylase [Demequina sp. SYSU T00b26]